MLEKIRDAVDWLNAVPGRKRGIAAIILGAAAALRALGHTEWAQGLEAANGVVQTYLVPGGDIVGGIMAIWGLAAAKKL